MAGNEVRTPGTWKQKNLNAKLVFDLVYNPIETPLIRHGPGQQGIAVIDGCGDVRPAGCSPIRDLDRQTRPRRRDAPRSPPRPQIASHTKKCVVTRHTKVYSYRNFNLYGFPKQLKWLKNPSPYSISRSRTKLKRSTYNPLRDNLTILTNRHMLFDFSLHVLIFGQLRVDRINFLSNCN